MFEKFIANFAIPEKKFFGSLIAGLLIFSFIFFTLITYNIASQGFFYGDIEITKGIQNYTFLTAPMVIVSSFGQLSVTILLFLLVLSFLYRKGYRKEAAFIPAVLLTPALNVLLKELVARPRPAGTFANALDPLSQYSYPSGHVMYFVVFFGFLAFLAASLPKLKPKWRLLWLSISLPLIILVGLSRVYLGAHWPSDVVGAYLIGGLYLLVLILIYLKYVYELPKVGDKKKQPYNSGKN